MAVEQIMYFALGFLIASLLALITMPSVWKRAVRLTKKRIEAATPITMAEFRADKDQLRAQFALDTRRLERNIETLRGKLTEQLADLNNTRTELAMARTERDRATEIRAELEERHENAHERIIELEREVANLAQQLRNRERDIFNLKSASNAPATQPSPLATAEPAPKETKRSAVSSIKKALSLGEKDTFDALDGINEAYSRISDAGSSLDALLDEANGTVQPSLAEELSQDEAREDLHKKIVDIETRIEKDWGSETCDKPALRNDLNDIATAVSQLIYASDSDPQEESLFDRIRKFAGETIDDGDTDSPADKKQAEKKLSTLTGSTSLSDRLSAYRNSHVSN